MSEKTRKKTLGFFTRLLEDVSPQERYTSALEQIDAAERLGFHSAWVAQHHFHENEGGLPSPLVLLSAAAERTARIHLATGVITLPMENPVRVAEDAAVVDALSSGRLQIGLGSGGNPQSFPAFGRAFEDRGEIFASHLETLETLWQGGETEGGNRLYPAAPGLLERLWQASFGSFGAGIAGSRGDGLMLSRTQPRPGRTDAPLSEIQVPVVEAYLAELPKGTDPRIMASRTAIAVDAKNHSDLVRRTTEKLRRGEADRLVGYDTSSLSDEELLVATDTYLGTPDEIVARLREDVIVRDYATQVAFQVHSAPATHEETLRSLELLATEVAPALGI
ncbi:putative FMN-dependent luciferase-like monooxygenase [Rothia uropygialis]|uniref:putative FMN-dependent luciferase-like monooxygenase n=1 Tax=Kocuria sp. 36 TaxID=1415402 RepID=UPI00101D9928|nr:putative FMN-dependent luciferase-like monooxygenase [Kocuria sp. 36]